jgi:hypothetical protein
MRTVTESVFKDCRTFIMGARNYARMSIDVDDNVSYYIYDKRGKEVLAAEEVSPEDIHGTHCPGMCRVRADIYDQVCGYEIEIS